MNINLSNPVRTLGRQFFEGNNSKPANASSNHYDVSKRNEILKILFIQIAAIYNHLSMNATQNADSDPTMGFNGLDKNVDFKKTIDQFKEFGVKGKNADGKWVEVYVKEGDIKKHGGKTEALMHKLKEKGINDLSELKTENAIYGRVKDREVFSGITAKTADGKKIDVNISPKDAKKYGSIENAISEKLKKKGINDISQLSDIQKKTKVEKGVYTNDINAKGINEIAQGKKDFKDFRKKGFFEKIFGGVKDFFVGIGKGIANVAKGIFNGVKNIVVGVGKGIGGLVKGAFTGDFSLAKEGLNGIKNGFGNIATGVKSGLGNIIDGAKSAITNISGAFLGDRVGNFLGNAWGKVANFGKSLITSVTDGASRAVDGIAGIANGGNIWENLKKIGTGAFDVVTGVTGFKGAVIGAKAGFNLIKGIGAGAKAGAKSGLKEGVKASKQSVKKADDKMLHKSQAKYNEKGQVGKLADDMKQKFSPFNNNKTKDLFVNKTLPTMNKILETPSDATVQKNQHSVFAYDQTSKSSVSWS